MTPEEKDINKAMTPIKTDHEKTSSVFLKICVIIK